MTKASAIAHQSSAHLSTIEGAATRPGAKCALVAIQVDIGATKIKKSDRADLLQHLSDTFQVTTAARVGGKPVDLAGLR